MLIKARSSRELVAAIKLNPEFHKDAAFLNGMQNEIAGVHLLSLFDICDAELFLAAGAAAAPVASPASGSRRRCYAARCTIGSGRIRPP